MVRILLKLSVNKADEFQQFILGHKKVDSFQRMETYFLLKLMSMNEEEFLAFFQGMKETFQVINMRPLCRAKCRDDTDCLNTAIEGYCWKHKKV